MVELRTTRIEQAEAEQLEHALLLRIATGSREALTSLYERYHDALFRFTYRITDDVESAQEAVNDVMLAVWRKASSFEGRSKVSTWIMGIAYRKALRHRSNSQKWSFRFKAANWDESIEPRAKVEAQTNELITQELLHKAIQRLSPKHRAVVELTYFFDYSYEEIARIVGCPENTVKTRMFHARKKLKEILPQLSGRSAGERDGQ